MFRFFCRARKDFCCDASRSSGRLGADGQGEQTDDVQRGKKKQRKTKKKRKKKFELCLFLFFLLLFVCLFLLSQTFLYLQRWTSKALSKSSKNAFCSCRRFTHTSDLCSCLSIRCVLFLSSLHCQLLLLSFSFFFSFFLFSVRENSKHCGSSSDELLSRQILP